MLPSPPRSTLFPYTTLFRSHRPRVEREAELERLLHRPEDELVEQLQGAGDDAGPDDVADRVGCVVDRGEHAEQRPRSEEHTSELQSRQYLVCSLLLEKKNKY